LALYVLVKRLASTNLPTEMSLFDSRFWLVLIIATIGGFLVAIIRVVTDKQRNELTTSLAIVSVVRDTLAGIGASFIVLTMSQAVNKSNIGLLLVAFVASLGGTGIINQFLLSQGYKDERNLFGSATTTDDNVELLKSELERIRHELEMIQVNLSDKQSADDMSFDVGEGN